MIELLLLSVWLRHNVCITKEFAFSEEDLDSLIAGVFSCLTKLNESTQRVHSPPEELVWWGLGATRLQKPALLSAGEPLHFTFSPFAHEKTGVLSLLRWL